MTEAAPEDIRALRRDKYEDDPDADMAADLDRLTHGEPLAYIIGWVPFLGLRIDLASRPLIPRPETEWWCELLISDLREKHGDSLFTFLDLCAGSGAIGLSVLKTFPHAQVAFAEIVPEHLELIRKNIEINGLDASRVSLYESDLFDDVPGHFDCIASNPPYVPEDRELPESVIGFEPKEALFAGSDGLSLIRRIAQEAPDRTDALWLECDSGHAEAAKELLESGGTASVTLHTDLYGRPRLLVSYYGHHA